MLVRLQAMLDEAMKPLLSKDAANIVILFVKTIPLSVFSFIFHAIRHQKAMLIGGKKEK